ncbi:MAG TPA: DsbA family protein [Chthoniobacterales bacterium]|nr:DsbA family protein [Chthoniobacterales bacterium]
MAKSNPGSYAIDLMKLKITYYLDVASSWCFLAEPAWAALRDRYAGRVDFEWKIALMDKAGLPTSREQLAWFYRRSGTIMRSPFMLQTGWLQPGAAEYPVRNCVAEAAREMGVTDDRVRLALATAVLKDGQQADQWDRAVEIGAEAGGLDRSKLLDQARAPEIETRVRASTSEFHSLKVTQRPTFVIDSEIGDRAVFSGFAKLPPLAATVDAMLEDIAGYESYAAHFGLPPSN